MSTRSKRRKKANVEPQVEDTKITLRNEIKPKTHNQKLYVDSIMNNEITFCIGPAGSGKSLLAVNAACVYLARGLVEKIVITRPMVQCGKGLGYLPGNISEKFHSYASPILDALEMLLGKAQLAHLIQNEVIEILPLELCRGENFHKTFVIADEMQNATEKQLLLLLTRHGQNTKTILTGDPKQTDLMFNEFSVVVSKLANPAVVEGIGIVQLERKDIQRSGIIARILERLE